MMQHSTIWITGSKGQLGSEISLMASHFPGLEIKGTDIDDLDITDLKQAERFVEQFRPDFLINCAAYTAVDRAEEEAETAFRINGLGALNLARVCSINNVKMIHISTDYVYDGQSKFPYTEVSPVNPQSVYGRSKLEGEQFVMASHQAAIIVRTAWLYSSFGSNFVKTMLRIGKERSEVRVVADQTGSPTYARDLANALLAIIQTTISDSEFWTPGIYHYSNEGVCTWYDFAVAIMKEANLSCSVVPVTTPEYPLVATRPAYSVLSKSKFHYTFGQTIPQWRVSLKECIQLLTKK